MIPSFSQFLQKEASSYPPYGFRKDTANSGHLVHQYDLYVNQFNIFVRFSRIVRDIGIYGESSYDVEVFLDGRVVDIKHDQNLNKMSYLRIISTVVDIVQQENLGKTYVIYPPKNYARETLKQVKSQLITGAYWAWKHKSGTVVLETSRIPVV